MSVEEKLAEFFSPSTVFANCLSKVNGKSLRGSKCLSLKFAIINGGVEAVFMDMDKNLLSFPLIKYFKKKNRAKPGMFR